MSSNMKSFEDALKQRYGKTEAVNERKIAVKKISQKEVDRWSKLENDHAAEAARLDKAGAPQHNIMHHRKKALEASKMYQKLKKQLADK